MGGLMTKVLPGLYLGCMDNANDDEELMANCVSHIVFVQNAKYEIEKFSGRRYLQLVIFERDEQGLLRHLSEANDFIHSARMEMGNVLVCSDSGLSSNIAVVAAYLMSVYNLSWQSAVAALQGMKHGACPVALLQSQLELFDSQPGVDTSIHSEADSPSPNVTAHTEHERLLAKFGLWHYFNEDLKLLHAAIESFNTLSHIDFVPLSYERISSSHPSSTNNTHPLSGGPVGRPAATSDIPLTNCTSFNPSTTNHLPRSISAENEVRPPVDLNSLFQPNGELIQETELFPLDPSIMDPNELVPSERGDTPTSTWSVRNGRTATHELADEPDEVGVDVFHNEDEIDDVPGAIPMPSVGGRPISAHSYRRHMASSYQTAAGAFSFDFDHKRPLLAQSLAPSRTVLPR